MENVETATPILKPIAMAELNNNSNNGKEKRGFSKRKTLSTKVDLTPMVDLGFLLITFFIFTTSLQSASVMRMTLPDEKGKPTPVKASSTLTLLLASDHQVYYYSGEYDKDTSLLSSPIQQIRDVIVLKKQQSDSSFFSIIIKAGNTSVYKDVVDLLDEMTIADVKRFALVDITSKEELQIK